MLATTKRNRVTPWLMGGALFLGACSSGSADEQTLDEQPSESADQVDTSDSDRDAGEAPSSIGEIIDDAGADRNYTGCYETVFTAAGVEIPGDADAMPGVLDGLDESAQLGFQECVRYVNSQD